MGLFSKNEPCPVCGGEVKGLFLVKIADKKTLCKDCSGQVSMSEELRKTATPDFIKEHLTYRRSNAERYTAAHWDAEYTDVNGLDVGVDLEAKILYLKNDDMHDEDNPVIFSFDQITGYELYRMMKKVDSADDPGETALESGLSKMATVAKLVSSKSSNSNDYFKLRLTTTDPYWPSIELKFFTSSSWLYGFGGYAQQMKTICQVFKRAAQNEPVRI